MMKQPVTIRTQRYGVFCGIGATIGELLDMMKLKKWLTIFVFERRGMPA